MQFTKFNQFILEKSEEIYNKILNSNNSAENELKYFFKKNHSLGSNDRKIIAEIIYEILKNKILLEYYLTKNKMTINARNIILLFCVFNKKIDNINRINANQEIKEIIEKINNFIYEENLPLSIKYSIPDWLISEWAEYYSEFEIKKICEEYHKEAALIIRTNTIKIKRDELIKKLEANGIEAKPTKISPDGIIVDKRKNLFELELFKKGYFEIQDEGSQIISYLAEARQGIKVFDACAGGGGKSLHIANLMNNKGLIYAFDINENRLKKIKPRIKRANISNIRLIFDKKKIKRLYNKFDVILIDTPCSGTGVIRRKPDILLKLTKEKIEKLSEEQLEILDEYNPILKIGGRLIYATCSIQKKENEEVIKKFLERNKNYEIIPVNEILKRQKISLEFSDEFLKLLPIKHNTDGFFAAV
ncbi:MAG TPA: methyltransferase domain-containing protein [bacterium]|nr:methyltransferase domain-containing protein [bacterium]